jgi:hypothetical protein
MLHWASCHRSIMHSDILLTNKRVYRLDIFLVAIGCISYLILIQQVYLGVCYKYLCCYNRYSSGTLRVSLLVYAILIWVWYLYYVQKFWMADFLSIYIMYRNIECVSPQISNYAENRAFWMADFLSIYIMYRSIECVSPQISNYAENRAFWMADFLSTVVFN